MEKIIISLPKPELAFTNYIYTDSNIPESYIRIGEYIFKSVPWNGIPQNSIAMNSYQRLNVNLSLGMVVGVEIMNIDNVNVETNTEEKETKVCEIKNITMSIKNSKLQKEEKIQTFHISWSHTDF